jgi:hypothetical protein
MELFIYALKNEAFIILYNKIIESCLICKGIVNFLKLGLLSDLLMIY